MPNTSIQRTRATKRLGVFGFRGMARGADCGHQAISAHLGEIYQMNLDDFLQLQEYLYEIQKEIRKEYDKIFEITPTLHRYSSTKGVLYHLDEAEKGLERIQGKMLQHERTKATRQALGLTR